MLEWITNYAGTIAVFLVIIGISIAIIIKLRNDRKRGRSSCECGCKNCVMANICHKSKEI